MNTETKSCQSCQRNFTVEPEDFSFYEKIGVPPPTWCPECRRQRRFSFRNEWRLYRRTCDLCRGDIFAMYPPAAPFPVYCHSCWYGDGWDAASYGRPYDFSRPFFSQMKELLATVPRLALFQRNSTNCSFTNMVGESKNVYASCSVTHNSEDISYAKFIDQSSHVLDSFSVTNSEYCYENVNCDRNHSTSFAVLSRNCIDCRFVFDCVNCSNCILSSNLRNKKFVIRNREYSREGYFRELERMNFGSREAVGKYLEEFEGIRKLAIHRYADVTKTVDTTGDHVTNAKNVKHCFEAHDVEDSKYCYRILKCKGFYDVDYGGFDSELIYEYITGAKHDYRVFFSVAALDAVSDAYYTNYCANLEHGFGCAGLKGKKYCILNKQYSEEEYRALLPRIKEHMDDMPYADARGRVYRFGEFFPPDMSPFAYNETLAQEHFPLTRAGAEAQGFTWKDPEEKRFQITKAFSDLPDRIGDASDAVAQDIISCSHGGTCGYPCTTAFKITPSEIQFYRKMVLPLPQSCPSCRYHERVSQQNPLTLWHRQCMCDYEVYKNSIKHSHHEVGKCPNEFETSYAPDRKEIVYCESCYQAEVA